jgi:protein TonB
VKQLLPAAVLAIAIHGLLFYLEFPGSKRASVIPELKTLSIVLTREKKQAPPAPVLQPASKPVIPPAPAEPERTVSPALKPREKPTPKRAEEKKRVAVQKKIPALLPPPVVDAKPAPENVVAETVLPVTANAPAPEEIKGETASSRKSPSASNEAAPSVTAGGGHITEARPLYKKNPHPYYPNIARKRNAQGTVVILALVNESGKVEQARVETSSGHALLDEAAITAVKSWEFEPGRRGGIAVKNYVKLPITFQLK